MSRSGSTVMETKKSLEPKSEPSRSWSVAIFAVSSGQVSAQLA